MSCPSATVMSAMTCVALVKMSLPFPALFWTLVNVSSRFSPDWIVSSSIPVLRIIDPARFATCFAVTPAAPPVDLMTAAVCAATFADCVSSSIPTFNVPVSAARPAAPPATTAARANPFSLDPNPCAPAPACFIPELRPDVLR